MLLFIACLSFVLWKGDKRKNYVSYKEQLTALGGTDIKVNLLNRWETTLSLSLSLTAITVMGLDKIVALQQDVVLIGGKGYVQPASLRQWCHS